MKIDKRIAPMIQRVLTENELCGNEKDASRAFDAVKAWWKKHGDTLSDRVVYLVERSVYPFNRQWSVDFRRDFSLTRKIKNDLVESKGTEKYATIGAIVAGHKGLKNAMRDFLSLARKHGLTVTLKLADRLSDAVFSDTPEVRKDIMEPGHKPVAGAYRSRIVPITKPTPEQIADAKAYAKRRRPK